MTGIDGYNFPAFEKAADHLRAQGLDIYSPTDIDMGETPETRGMKPHSEYLKACLKVLVECEVAIMMPGWPQSKGAQVEFMVALAMGMKIFILSKEYELTRVA